MGVQALSMILPGPQTRTGELLGKGVTSCSGPLLTPRVLCALLGALKHLREMIRRPKRVCDPGQISKHGQVLDTG